MKPELKHDAKHETTSDVSCRGGTQRLPSGGAIDRKIRLHFRFDGKSYYGHAGDTLASALLANGVVLTGRSFKYHRPRGILSAGPEEPNALVQLQPGTASTEPNARATVIALYDGLEAHSQNRWPGLRWDLQAVTGWLAPLLPAGFYYKTFKWPALLWPHYERLIRHAAGMGRAPRHSDPDRYDRQHAFCDVLVVGGGAAGLSAALSAAQHGADVIVADEREQPGGLTIDPAQQAWLADTLAKLRLLPNVRLLPRTTVFGYYDHNQLAAIERCSVAEATVATVATVAAAAAAAPRQRLWQIRARHTVLATGAIERPMLFANNDLPAIYLASAALAYVQQYAVRIGQRVVVYGNNDDVLHAALRLAEAGIAVAAAIDTRPLAQDTGASASAALKAALAEHGIAYFPAAQISKAVGTRTGQKRVRAVHVRRHPAAATDASPDTSAAASSRQGDIVVACDTVLMAGGWNPVVHLFSQSGGKLCFDHRLAAPIPAAGSTKQATVVAGAARGLFALEEVRQDGAAAGLLAAGAIAAAAPATAPARETSLASDGTYAISAPAAQAGGAVFVDYQADVTTGDIALAVRENYRSVEHLKRYTTLGMGTDQGKTSNINGLAMLALARGAEMAGVGTTTFRPPYTPVTFGALAGRAIGPRFAPARQTPLHRWHQANGALFSPAGLWQRAAVFLRPGETADEATRREAAHVRHAVGLADISTLGKIAVAGPDAMAFLDRVYCNNIATLQVGRLRYGLMLREDGIVLDDGTVARLSQQHFLLTATTANADKVLSHLECLLATVWPDLRVRISAVTEQYAQFALAGPRSQAVLADWLPACDSSETALPPNAVIATVWQGQSVQIARISFSGERAYELSIAADHGTALWQSLLAAGRVQEIAPYGADAVTVLRIEAGHVAGPELNGTTTPGDLGLGKLAAKQRDYIGRRLLQRAGLQQLQRPALVGLLASDPAQSLRAGAVLVNPGSPGNGTTPAYAAGNTAGNNSANKNSIGWISSAAYSPRLGRWVALAMLDGGTTHIAQTLTARSPLHGDERIAVTVVAPGFLDLPVAVQSVPGATPASITASMTAAHQGGPASFAVSATISLPHRAMDGFAAASSADTTTTALAPAGVILQDTTPAIMVEAGSWQRHRFDDAHPAIGTLLQRHFGLPAALLPNRWTALNGIAIVASGPHNWLLLADGDHNNDSHWLQTLASAVASAAAITDCSAGKWQQLTLTGPRARDLLSRLCALDFSPTEFPPATAYAVALHDVAVQLRCEAAAQDTASGEKFHLLLPRSYAACLLDWIVDAAGDIPCRIEPHHAAPCCTGNA